MANRTFNDVKLFVAFQMASQREQLPNNANISQLMGILAKYVNDFHSCAFNGDASTVNGHSVATDVPSNAKFTDTITPVMDNLTVCSFRKRGWLVSRKRALQRDARS